MRPGLRQGLWLRALAGFAALGQGPEALAAIADRPRPQEIREIQAGRTASLWEILRDAGEGPIPTAETFRFLEALKRLNPDLRDPGRIPAGTRIRIPALREAEPLRARPLSALVLLRPGPGWGETPLPQGAGKAPPSAAGPEGRPRRGEGRQPEPQIVRAPPLAFTIDQGALGRPVRRDPAEEARARHSIGSVFAALDEGVRTSGEGTWALAGGGTIRLDLGRFPLVAIGPRRILFDVRGALPPEIVAAMEAQDGDLSVVRGRGGRLTETIQGALTRAGYYAVRRRGQIDLGDGARLTLEGDWLILKDEESILEGRVYLLNLIADGSGATPPAIVAYARKRGILLSDILVGGGRISGRRRPAAGASPDPAPPMSLEASGPQAVVDGLLAILGIQAEAEAPLDLGEGGAGYRVRVRGDRLFRWRGQPHVIDFGAIPEALHTWLRSQGYRTVRVPAGPPEGVARIVLDLLGIPHRQAEEGISGPLMPPGRRIQLRVPGIFVREATVRDPSGASRRTALLLTRIRLDAELEAYLAERGVQIVHF